MSDRLSFKEATAELVREALEGRMKFLVLRGVDERAREGGDIDVLVHRNNSSEALMLIANMAVETGWSVAGIADIGYLSQICLVKRWGDGASHQAIKIDIFNGVSWVALGEDLLGLVLFEWLENNGESVAIGLTTLLQKLLYAGYLRDRDWERITASCNSQQIDAFIKATDINLTQTDLELRKLDILARWKLRALSAGVRPANLPIWVTSVVWRKFVFTTIRSSIVGSVFVISGADAPRRKTVAERFRALVLQSEFLEPLIKFTDSERKSQTKIWSWNAASIWWRAFRGEMVLVDGASFQQTSPQSQSSSIIVKSVYVELSDDGDDLQAHDDLDTLLECVSKQAMQTLERIQIS